MKQKEHEYRPINVELLDKSHLGDFEFFYKTESFGETRFVKFSGREPAHLEKLRGLIESGELQEKLYIKETDRMKYHGQATESLRALVNDPKVKLEVKVGKVYEVSKEIMKEFFDFGASTNILRYSDQAIENMEDCLIQNKELGFFLIAKIASKDYYTYTHSINVGMYCMVFGLQTNMSDTDSLELGLGGMLHDVGKVKIPREILDKNGKLTDSEFEQVKSHCVFGEEMLIEMMCYGERVVEVAGQHHERFGGGGYPMDKSGDAISHFSRICKVMDVYDALTTRRSYKNAMTPLEALKVMNNDMKGHFDSTIFADFIRKMGPKN